MGSRKDVGIENKRRNKRERREESNVLSGTGRVETPQNVHI